MTRVLGDRYVIGDQTHAYELATGEQVQLDAIGQHEEGCGEDDPAPLIEVLAHGRDGSPRWIVADARDEVEVEAMSRRVAVVARRKGFVPIALKLY